MGHYTDEPIYGVSDSTLDPDWPAPLPADAVAPEYREIKRLKEDKFALSRAVLALSNALVLAMPTVTDLAVARTIGLHTTIAKASLVAVREGWSE